MNFTKKTENEIILRFKNGENLFLNSKNLLKEGWPIYELWVNTIFLGHWEFIPNKTVGINSSDQHRYWAFIYDFLFIFDSNHIPNVVLQKKGGDFIGHQIDNFDIVYHLKYIET